MLHKQSYVLFYNILVIFSPLLVIYSILMVQQINIFLYLICLSNIFMIYNFLNIVLCKLFFKIVVVQIEKYKRFWIKIYKTNKYYFDSDYNISSMLEIKYYKLWTS